MLDVLLHTHRELDVVTFVNRVGVALFREAHALLAQAEDAKGRVVGKGVDAAAGGINQHRRGAVNHIARGDLSVARLQEIFFSNGVSTGATRR